MAINLNVGRQEPALANVVFTIGTAGDVTAAGTNAAIQIPQGAVISRGWIYVSAAANAGVTVAVSDSGSSYLGATSVAATGLTPLVPTGKTSIAQDNINVVVAGTPGATKGTVELVVEYYQQGKAEWSQG